MTLIEVIVAAAILGTVMVALVGGMFAAIKAADTHRRFATAETALRTYVESVEATETTTYHECPANPDSVWAPQTIGGFTVHVKAVSVWVKDSNPATFTTCPPGSPSGAQKITIEVVDPSGRATQSTDIVVRSSS